MKEDFTTYDIKPEAFVNYLRYYGEHFNKKLCEFACKQLPKHDYSKEKLDILLQSHGIEIKGAKLYDYVYVANWCKSMFYGSSITDEKRFVLFIKDVFEKMDTIPQKSLFGLDTKYFLISVPIISKTKFREAFVKIIREKIEECRACLEKL